MDEFTIEREAVRKVCRSYLEWSRLFTDPPMEVAALRRLQGAISLLIKLLEEPVPVVPEKGQEDSGCEQPS